MKIKTNIVKPRIPYTSALFCLHCLRAGTKPGSMEKRRFISQS